MKRMILVGVALVLATAVFFAWRWYRSDDQIRVLATEVVSRGTVRQVLEQTGIVKAQVGAIVKIGARATGTIDRMLVKVGDEVRKEQLVARIDNREIGAQVREAEAALQGAETELSRIRQVYPLRIREAEANLALAEAQARYQAGNLLRITALADSGVVSRDELENTRQRAEVEQRRQAALQAALERERREYLDQARKAEQVLEQARAGLAALRVRASYTLIHSPIAGVVSQVTAQEGETIVAGLQVANLITVLDPSRLEMWIYVDETDIGRVRHGQAVEFRVDAYPGRIFPGTVAEIYPEPEIRDNIVYYRALVAIDDEQAQWLRPEMTTQVQIVVAEKAQVLRLPNMALKWVDGRQVVFAVDAAGAVRELQPELGLTGLQYSEILGGLAEGQRVATQVELGSARAAAGGGPRPGSGAGGGGGGGRGPR
jgi:HlyD family secretion protein/macrolide-specific efflux system membrane fusion protein